MGKHDPPPPTPPRLCPHADADTHNEPFDVDGKTRGYNVVCKCGQWVRTVTTK